MLHSERGQCFPDWKHFWSKCQQNHWKWFGVFYILLEMWIKTAGTWGPSVNAILAFVCTTPVLSRSEFSQVSSSISWGNVYFRWDWAGYPACRLRLSLCGCCLPVMCDWRKGCCWRELISNCELQYEHQLGSVQISRSSPKHVCSPWVAVVAWHSSADSVAMCEDQAWPAWCPRDVLDYDSHQPCLHGALSFAFCLNTSVREF